MTERFKPDLILLDNFLPDGRGITLLRELTLSGYRGGIVFITAASDMATVAEALRYGVFDYLIKPLAYDRLSQTLQRFSQRREALKDKARLNQRRIDEMFNTYARGEQQAALPAGIDELTLGKVRALFAEPAARHTAESVAQNGAQPHHRAPLSGVLHRRTAAARRDHLRQGRPPAADLPRRRTALTVI